MLWARAMASVLVMALVRSRGGVRFSHVSGISEELEGTLLKRIGMQQFENARERPGEAKGELHESNFASFGHRPSVCRFRIRFDRRTHAGNPAGKNDGGAAQHCGGHHER